MAGWRAAGWRAGWSENIALGLGGGGRRGLDKGGWMDGGAWMEGRWMEEA